VLLVPVGQHSVAVPAAHTAEEVIEDLGERLAELRMQERVEDRVECGVEPQKPERELVDRVLHAVHTYPAHDEREDKDEERTGGLLILRQVLVLPAISLAGAGRHGQRRPFPGLLRDHFQDQLLADLLVDASLRLGDHHRWRRQGVQLGVFGPVLRGESGQRA